MDRKQLMDYAKRNAQPANAAVLLAKKKAEAAKLKAASEAPLVDSHLGAADSVTPKISEGALPHELVFEAEAAALEGADSELEDAIASEEAPEGEAAMAAPKWAQDTEKWQAAAEAVGLDLPGIEEKFEEPFVVAAYLYKKLGGTVKVEGLPEAPGAELLS